MRATAGWQPGRSGVLLYMPATHVSVQDTQQSLPHLSVTDSESSAAQSQASRISNTIVPTCEDQPNVYIKSESPEGHVFNFSRDDSPATLADETYDEIPFSAESTVLSTPESSASQDLLFQLIAAAESISPEANNAISANNLWPTNEEFGNVGYETERTDFLEDSLSPSLRRNREIRRRTTGTRSRHFRTFPQHLTNLPVARLLNFGPSALQRTQAQRTSAPPKRASGALEKVPGHKYTSDEREILCVLNRFYTSPDEDAIPRLFNTIAGLTLRHSVIEGYFRHLCLYGPKAYFVLARVLSVPLDDPHGCYTQVCTTIEQQAQALGIQLIRRHKERNLRYGEAESRRTPRTRKIFKNLVRKAREEEKEEAANMLVVHASYAATRPFHTMSMAAQVPLENYDEVFTDAETSPVPCLEIEANPIITSNKPHLAFRVWDSESRAQFTEDGGFLSEMFGATEWNGKPIKPFTLSDQGLNALLIFTTFHLSMSSKVPSAFVSVSTSLLQVLCKASKMTDPRIAIIDLNHPALKEEHKILHASEVLAWLKSQGQACWARYKGRTEYLIWGDIPRDAVIYHMDLSELQNLAKHDQTCRIILQLDQFVAGRATPTVSKNIGEKKSVLNTQTAKAMGRVAKIFGLDSDKVSLEHVTLFVAELINGWSIDSSSLNDVHTSSSIASAFATALGSATYGVQNIMFAFNEGVKEGIKLMIKYGRSS